VKVGAFGRGNGRDGGEAPELAYPWLAGRVAAPAGRREDGEAAFAACFDERVDLVGFGA
jgi:hypothetical protein